MIAVDTNVLVHAHRREGHQHAVAKERVRELAEGSVPWAIAWPCLYEFLATVTHRKLYQEAASTPDQAWAQLAAWIASPSLVLLAETEDFLAVLERFVQRPRVVGPVVHDARVAAICVAHGVSVLLTRDRDFRSFPELQTENPFS